MKRIRMILVCVFAVLLMGVGTAGSVYADNKAESEKTVVSTVNINKAGAVELADVLFNVGKSKAEAIVKYREAHGPFTSKEQLLSIKGIGEGTLKKNRALITL